MGIKIFAFVLVVAGIAALGYMGYSMVNAIVVNAAGNQTRAEVVGEAPKDALAGFESFTADDSAFDVGVNKYGKTIFEDNAAALKAAKEKCAQAIEEMRTQAPELGRFSAGNIYNYYDYSWQINWDDVDEDVYIQSQFLNKFLAYYVYGDPNLDVN
jgi:hypothetical protein